MWNRPLFRSRVSGCSPRRRLLALRRRGADDDGPPARFHTVREGEGLWSVAAAALGPRASATDIATYWPLVHEANREVIGPDPRVLPAGALLFLPTPDSASWPRGGSES
ncbi:hypothetical protein [Falsarthrobacter nasiphocae]|uniref:LysM domain-containing protein n=1 Tax=Falsarthrobacter nasiphocae TaxID=189863 RepID=A0AAE3YDY9_9MICC|nr:hypothetical protein [Falsarthrobacter nasiphocae]MDR6891420.1 hypothetical protein [Falsarthrobacter nasiphocae]